MTGAFRDVGRPDFGGARVLLDRDTDMDAVFAKRISDPALHCRSSRFRRTVRGACHGDAMYDAGDIDGRLLVRPRARCKAPRRPDDDMFDAPVHIVVASWRALTGDPEWPRQLRWIVVVADRARRGGRPVVHRHRLERTDGAGWPKLVASVRDCIAQGSGPAWVAVSTKRIATANVLCEAGFPVTIGLAGNRAADQAIEDVQESRRRETLVQESADLYDHEAGPVRVGAGECAPVCEWLPELDRPMRDLPVLRLVVATDASADLSGAVVSAAVGADGALAMESTVADYPISEAELNAISLALERYGPNVTDELCVLSDSVDAVQVAQAIAHDRVPVEGFRGIGDDALDRFEDAWNRLDCAVQFFHVKGHVGHPLNEAADELAVIGRLATRHPRAVVEHELDQRASELSAAVRLLRDDEVSIPEYELSMRDDESLSWSLGELFGDLDVSVVQVD